MANNNLREFLKVEGIKISQLAKETGFSYAFVHRVVSQKTNGAPTSQFALIKGLSKLAEKEISHQEVFPETKK